MDRKQIIKLALRIVASASVNSVMGNALILVTPQNLSNANRVLTKLGGYIISSMVAEKGADYVVNVVEEVIPSMKEEKSTEQEKETE
jgi:hypothetical protein